MQMWSVIKKESQPKNIQTLIEETLERKKRKDAMLGLGQNDGNNKEEDE